MVKKPGSLKRKPGSVITGRQTFIPKSNSQTLIYPQPTALVKLKQNEPGKINLPNSNVFIISLRTVVRGVRL